MFGLGTPELLIIAGVVVLLFGAGAIPKFARSVGQAQKEFENGVSDGSQDAPGEDNTESTWNFPNNLLNDS